MANCKAGAKLETFRTARNAGGISEAFPRWDAVGVPPHVSPEEFQQAGVSLIEAILEVLPEWAQAHVVRLGGESLAAAGFASGTAAADALTGELRALIETDSDLQATTPLAIVRRAIAWPTEVLTASGVVVGQRDPFTADRFPEDIYELTPASWSDLGEEVNDLGIRWGVMKAFLHKQRHISSQVSEAPGHGLSI